MISEARKVSLKLITSESANNPDSLVSLALEETIRLIDCQLGFFGVYDEEKGELSETLWSSNHKAFSEANLPPGLNMEISPDWNENIWSLWDHRLQVYLTEWLFLFLMKVELHSL